MPPSSTPPNYDELVEPPESTPFDWEEGAITVRRFCDEYDFGRARAFQLMKSGLLVWGRLNGRTRRISRKSANNLLAKESNT